MGTIKIYVAVKMTGRFQDELVYESKLICRALRNYGFEPLSPVIEEGVIPVHEVLEQTDPKKLEMYWRRDKQMLQEAHILLDYMSCNKSDGVGVELGLTRFNYWKPIVRVFPNSGYCISKIEFDTVTGTLPDALVVMNERWGTKRKLLVWRLKMLCRCVPKFVWLQVRFLKECL